MEYAIEMKNITKNFGGVEALKNVNFKVVEGEVMGLVGKNGAGKSTLLKILRGIHKKHEGEIYFFGDKVNNKTSIVEREKTLSMIFQNFSLIPDMKVYHNIFLNKEPIKKGMIDEKKMLTKVEEFFDKFKIKISPHEKVKNLSTSNKQMVEITKAILHKKKVLLMDEPTASLEEDESKRLFDLINQLKDEGLTIILITHNLENIMDQCDSVSVLRDGAHIFTKKIENITMNAIIKAMLGENQYKKKKRNYRQLEKKEPILKLENIASANNPKGISFNLYPGEILGLAGLKGSGRTEILNNLFGVEKIKKGDMFLNNKRVEISAPYEAIQNGIFLVPEERTTQGLSLEHSLRVNMLLPLLDVLQGTIFIDDKKGNDIVNKYLDSLDIKTDTIFSKAKSLSGGNQQKVVVAKAMAVEPQILLMDDPTYGIDIQTKSYFIDLMDEITSDKKKSIILVASEIEELILACDRILVLKNHEIVDEYKENLKHDYSVEQITAAIQ